MVTYSADLSVRHLKDGEFWSTGFDFGTVASGETVKLVFENESEHDVYLPVMVVRAQFGGTVTKKFNVDIDTSDSNASFINKKSGAGTSVSWANAFSAGDGQTGSISGGESFNDKRMFSGEGNFRPGNTGEIGGNVVAPNDNIVLEVTNDNSEGVCSIDMDFIRMDNF